MWGIVALLIGLAYGYLSPGKEDKMRLLRNGFFIGVALALVFALIGYLTGSYPLGIGGMVGIVVSVLVVTLMFILGVWLGDLIEGRKERGRVEGPRTRRTV